MSVRYSGKQDKLRYKKIREVGTYQRIVEVCDEQSLVFGDDVVNLFYLSSEDQIRKKYNRFSSVTKIMENNLKKIWTS